MQKLFQRFFIYIITASIFISGNGVVLSIHTCLFSASKNVSLFEEKSCCSEKSDLCHSKYPDDKENFSSKCCTSEIIYQKINDPYKTQKSTSAPVIEFVSSSLFFFSNLSTAVLVYHHFIPPSVSFSIPITYNQLLI